MPTRQLRLHTPFLKTFLNNLQFLFIRPMTAPSFGTGNGLLAGVGLLLLMTATTTKSHITRKDGPRRRRTTDLGRLIVNAGLLAKVVAYAVVQLLSRSVG